MNASTITCTTPAHSEQKSRTVSVTTPGGLSAVTYAYFATERSANWSGFTQRANQAGTYTGVQAELIVPNVDAKNFGPGTDSSGWVGLGGAGDQDALIQTGITVGTDKTSKPIYYGWWEVEGKESTKEQPFANLSYRLATW